ncbi:iron-containing alcohol dehydrogenase [Microvirga makkahensis]|uniref:Alcohol dehydrogenase 2 n=1 Tax=Microvirga makkahensis TaxID=1128670 RepID=A0A7X3MP14_9HYPH|nr:iron-containing alcohol dehydrogenase [Microvirga makkahensis]MXQ10591.1 iron-containing alcohol dehydrogenase [Microvirga makkahensis]
MNDFTFQTTPRAICETGGLSRLGELMTGLGVGRAIVICDAGIAACGFGHRAVASLKAAGIGAAVFDQVQADPPVHVVRSAVEAARAFEADGVIGLGGGSSLDTAKLVALLVRSDQKIEELYGTDLARGRRLPLIQVPTTAGTGSEVTWVSVVTSDANEKKAIYSPQLLPDVALLDAELTLGMPPRVTAATALDAMVHAIEAYTSRTRKNVVSDALAMKGLQLLGANIRRVVADGSDIEARSAMLQGSMLAGMAFVNASVAAVHALSYPLGARFHVPHGHSNALVMSPVFRFNMPVAEKAYAELAACLLPDRRFASDAEAAEAFVAELEQLVASVGLETRLSQMGVTGADIPDMAKEVTVGIQRLLANNPRNMNFDEVVSIYQAVL